MCCRNVRSNHISTSIPESIVGCTNLSSIDISYNQFTGTIDILSRLPRLSVVSAQSNAQLRYNGTWPSYLRKSEYTHRGSGAFSCADLFVSGWSMFYVDDSYVGYSHCTCDMGATYLPPACERSSNSSECSALSDFYNAAGGPYWYWKEGWTDPAALRANCCLAYGVTCSWPSNHVVGLRLPYNGLVGFIPDSISALQYLTELCVAVFSPCVVVALPWL